MTNGRPRFSKERMLEHLRVRFDGTVQTWDQVQVAILMDIRDELKRLNNVLHCPNFIAVPSKLDAIKAELRQVRLNTRKKKRPVGKPKLRVVTG